ncbi:MAG: hypothetical protein ACP5OA_07655 [Candidatus Woesearchaeota archaeon]
MPNIFACPEWFFGYDIALEVIFAIVTLIVSFYAWKIYKVTDERNIRLFSLAFLFISVSYMVQSLLNIIMLTQMEDEVCSLINLQSIYLLNLFGIYLHAILFLIGLLLLTYIALKIYSLQTFVLLFILVFTSLYVSPYKTLLLYILSTTLLGFISYYYIANYWNNRKSTTLLVAIAMVILFAGYMHFIFATDNQTYYVMGHVFELIAYILVLINLTIILRAGKQKLKNGKKTR